MTIMDIINGILINSYENINKLSVDELEKVIDFAADKYYNEQNSVLPDNIYDICLDFLKLKNPKSKVLKNIGAKVKGKNKIKLDYWLGSMDKIKPFDEHVKTFEKWINKFKGPYYLSDKLDGISALLIYRKDGNINLYTRGTATEGLDITPLLKYVKTIPSWDIINKYKIGSNVKASHNNNIIALRGELIMKKETFNSNWKDKMKNSRNTVSGLVNSKTINPQLANDTDLVIYEVVDPFLTYNDQMKIIKDLGFNHVIYKSFDKINFEILSEYLLKRRSSDSVTNSKLNIKAPYEVDGIIVTNNELHKRNVSGNPEYAFAFKDVLDDQIAKTKVIDIEWNKSKDGYIKPTVIVEPITIGGVEINRVTGNNAKYIVDNNIGIGTEIELIRSGDVIPKIQTVLKPSKKLKLPDGDWHWNETKVDIICNDLNNKDILVKNIAYFFASLETKGLGDKIVEKLVTNGYDSILKIINLKEENLLKIDGFKEKSSKNLVESIKKSLTDVNLSKIMSASNKLGHGIGEERIKLVLEKYPNLLDISEKWSKIEFIENLKTINGWEEKTSSLFVNNFNEFKKFYNSIKKFITLKEINIINKSIVKNKYTDKTIVLSGFRDSNLQTKLEESGAKITNSISKNTDYLIVKDQQTIDDETGKVKKALELGVTILTKDKVII